MVIPPNSRLLVLAFLPILFASASASYLHFSKRFESPGEDGSGTSLSGSSRGANRLVSFGKNRNPAASADAEGNRSSDRSLISRRRNGASDGSELSEEERVSRRFGAIRKNGVWLPRGTLTGKTSDEDSGKEGENENQAAVYITTGSLPMGQVGEPYQAQLEAVGGVLPYQWIVQQGTLPPGLVLSPGTGLLAGTLEMSTTTSLQIQVTDAEQSSDTAGFVLVIEPEDPLRITTKELSVGRPGENYSVQLQATGGSPPYQWNLSGDLGSAGSLGLDPVSGLLTGSIDPDATEMQISLVIEVQDSQIIVTESFLLQISSESEGELAIVTEELPSGTEEEEYHAQLEATGGTRPYTWSAETNLPEGLTLSENGVLSGTPLASGEFSVKIVVTDENGERVESTIPLVVEAAGEEGIRNLTAFISLRRVALRWSYPPNAYPAQVQLVRSQSGFPSLPSEGQTVYFGEGTSFTDSGLEPGTVFYSAFLAGQEDPERFLPAQLDVALGGGGDPFADRVVGRSLLHPSAYNSHRLPEIATGPPRGAGLMSGGIDVVSLGAATNDDSGASASYGGSLVLEFSDNVVWDGPGADFTVFENVFYVGGDPENRFMEPAIVSVSQDGGAFYTFPFDFSPRYQADGELNLRHPFTYHRGFAGVNPVLSNGYDPDPTNPAVSGGDSFDIGELGLEWIRYVRIQSTGNRWLTDSNGDLVHHNEETFAAERKFDKSGFDLDTAAAIWFEKVEQP